jgi:single-strand DNA-binding protein
MAGDTYLTVSGNLTSAPKAGESRSGARWARLRVASTARVFDRTESSWRDGDTVFLDVVCWRRLAENVIATLQRGDRVLASGRLRQRSYQDAQGTKHIQVELEADSVGPDLARNPARLLRPPARDGAAAALRPSGDVQEGPVEARSVASSDSTADGSDLHADGSAAAGADASGWPEPALTG